MKHEKKIELPPYDPTQPGTHYITPIRTVWMEKGHFWDLREIAEFKHVFYRFEDKIYIRRFLIPVRLECKDLGIKSSDQETCKCKECKAGRKEVKLGWRPHPKKMAI